MLELCWKYWNCAGNNAGIVLEVLVLCWNNQEIVLDIPLLNAPLHCPYHNIPYHTIPYRCPSRLKRVNPKNMKKLKERKDTDEDETDCDDDNDNDDDKSEDDSSDVGE